MTKNPFYNAFAALVYIILLVTLLSFTTHFNGIENTTFLAPIGMLSLLVTSAAVMAYIFFYQPVILLLDGKRKDAVRLFWHTIAIFAVSAVVVMLLAFVIFK